jgi:hypothetical protein
MIHRAATIPTPPTPAPASVEGGRWLLVRVKESRKYGSKTQRIDTQFSPPLSVLIDPKRNLFVYSFSRPDERGLVFNIDKQQTITLMHYRSEELLRGSSEQIETGMVWTLTGVAGTTNLTCTYLFRRVVPSDSKAKDVPPDIASEEQ